MSKPLGPIVSSSHLAAGALPSLSEAASTMPSLIPNFSLRGARLATITVSRPTSVAGS